MRYSIIYDNFVEIYVQTSAYFLMCSPDGKESSRVKVDKLP